MWGIRSEGILKSEGNALTMGNGFIMSGLWLIVRACGHTWVQLIIGKVVFTTRFVYRQRT